MFLHSLRHSFGCICNIHILGISLFYTYVKHQIYNYTIQTFNCHTNMFTPHSDDTSTVILTQDFPGNLFALIICSHNNFRYSSLNLSQHTPLPAYPHSSRNIVRSLHCARKKRFTTLFFFQNRTPYV